MLTPELIGQFAAEWGPWAFVAYLLWKCIKRQNEREDRLAEVVRDSSKTMQELTDAIKGQAR